ncbi:MAG: DUF58 domain-containing protein [Acidimicrobiales bacterium]
MAAGRVMTANQQLRGTVSRPPSVTVTPSAEVIRRLELTITRRLDGMLHGDYRGLVPGHGSDPGETREYQPGDDVRRMDWNVTARLGTPHVRQTIADRELESWVLTDVTASLGFGTAGCEKRDLAVAAVAAVGFLTARGGNRVGAVTMQAGSLTTIPARSGRVNLQALLHRVIDAARQEREGAASLELALRRLGATMQRRDLAVVVSDFLDRSPWERPLRALAARHEVLAVEVVDPRELELPDVGLVQLRDPETGARLEVQTASPKLRQRYAARAADQRADIARRIRAAGSDHLVLRTDRDWLLDLVRLVVRRRERVDALTRARP